MKKAVFVAMACVLVGACQQSDTKVLIGATTIVSPGAMPIEDSVIVIAGSRIRAVGMRKDVPIPQDSVRFDVTGRKIAPVAGGRIAVNETADLVLTEGSDTRRMLRGQWQ